MLATIPLLGKTSDLALLEIVGHYNHKTIPLSKVNISAPVVLTGRRTRVTITSKGPTPYRSNNFIQSMNFTYNRLNLTEVFIQYVFNGIEIEAPVTTEKIIAHLKTFVPFIHDPSEFVTKIVFANGANFVLEAAPTSLRWVGSISIPLNIVTNIDELLIHDYLNGLDNLDLFAPIDLLFRKNFLDGLDYLELHPSLLELINQDILHGLTNQNFKTDLGLIIPNNVLPGHWIWNEEDEYEIVSDISLPTTEALRALIQGALLIPYIDFDILSVMPLASDWQSRGVVTIQAAPVHGLDGTEMLVFERINIEDLATGGAILVDSLDNLNVTLISINEQLGTALTLEEIILTLVGDEEDGVWLMTFFENNAMFYGELIVNDASVSALEFINGLVQISDTPYYKFPELVAYSLGAKEYGPSVVGGSPQQISLRQYKAEWSEIAPAGVVISRQNDLGNYEQVDKISVAVAPYHLSFTFDRWGRPILGWESEGNLFVYYPNTFPSSVTQTVNLGPGRSPFVILSTFNDVVDPGNTRQVFLIYIRNDNTLCYRAQLDTYTIEYVIASNVVDILTVGHTYFNNVKVEYVIDEGEGVYTVANISTERNSIWANDDIDSTINLIVNNMAVRGVETFLLGTTENPVELSRSVTEISITSSDP
jgi:hypothetical protein